MIEIKYPAIEKVRLVEVSIPYKIPFRISEGVSYNRKSIIVEISGDNITGYGESAPFEAPYYSSETISSVKAVLTEWLIPRIIGKRIKSIEEFNSIINEGIRGNNFAKAGLETAYWDFIARKNKISLKDLLLLKLKELDTGKNYLQSEDHILSGVSVGIPEDRDINTMEKWISTYLKDGYQRIKIKIKPGWDIKPLEISRKIVGRNFSLTSDANASYDLNKHLNILKDMDKFNCIYIEQPLHYNDILNHLKLSKEINTPICFDESLNSIYTAVHIVDLKIPSIWNIKIQRLGGLYPAAVLYSMASNESIELWGGTMPETGIGASFIIALASFKGFIYPSDVEPSKRWYGPGHDLIEIEMNKNGRINLSNDIGIGKINFKNYHKYGRVVYETQ